MSSKRHVRARCCGGKAAFVRAADAEVKCAMYRAAGGTGRVRAYRCPFCSTPDAPVWHWGHYAPGRRA